MKIFKRFKKLFRKPPLVENGKYRCPECGKFTDFAACVDYKQLVKCKHCGRVMVIYHGRTIGFK